MFTTLQLPQLDSNGYWIINTIGELVALAKNPEINIDNLLTDMTNFLISCREIKFASPCNLQWKDDGLQTIDFSCHVVSDSDPTKEIDHFCLTIDPINGEILVPEKKPENTEL